MAIYRLIPLVLIYWQYQHVLGQDTSCDGIEAPTCDSCFNMLVSKTITPDANQYNMQKAFFPPNTTNPVYVTVHYKFVHGNSKVWYWSKSTYYASFHPLEIYQFTSLFFGDFRFLSTQLTLNVNCSGVNVNEEFMMLLTQRLNLFAMGRSNTPSITDDYEPKAESKDTVRKYHTESYHPINLLMSAQFIIPFLATVWSIILLIYYIKNKKYIKKDGETDETKVKLGIVFTLSFMFVSYALLLSICALVNGHNELSSGATDWFNKEIQVLYGIFVMICVSDFVVFVVFIFTGVIAVLVAIRKEEKVWWYFCACSFIFPVITFAIHFNYIVFAFIHNKDHAVSIGIFYAIVVLVNIHVLYVVSTLKCAAQTKNMEMNCHCSRKACSLIFVQVVVSVLINLLFAYVAAIYILVPINKAFDEAPDRIRVIYDTLIVSFLGVLTYFFLQKKKDKEDKKKEEEAMINKIAQAMQQVLAQGLPKEKDTKL